jgi:DNA invertase Pin-like site-specific DNA recombinase
MTEIKTDNSAVIAKLQAENDALRKDAERYQLCIGFKSLTESIDTASAGGKLIFHIFGALAEFEHSIIKERTIAGLTAARARGRKGGRKPSMSDNDVKKAVTMLKDPLITKTEVAKHFNVSRVTLNNHLAKKVL